MGDGDQYTGLIAYIDFKFVNDVLTVSFYPIVDATNTYVMYNNGTSSDIDPLQLDALLNDLVLAVYNQGMGYQTEILPAGSIIYNGQKASYSIG